MAKLNFIECFQGETKSFSITLTDSGEPYNLTGYTAALRIGTQFGAVELLEVTGTITANAIAFTVTAEQTATLEPGRYSSDCSITSAAGAVTYLFSVPWIVESTITNGD